MHIEQNLSRFLSEMVLAPSLGLKKSVTIYRDVMYIVMGFLHYILEKSGGVYGNRNYRR